MALTHEQRKLALEEAQKKDIVDVAQSLGIDLVQVGRNYTWSEHDSFIIQPKKNLFYWNSQQKGGGVIQLVQLMNKCSYKDAVNYLTTKDLGTYNTELAREAPKPFHYYMKEHKQMVAGIDYLTNQRNLSKETVDFFISNGYLAQSTYTDKNTNETEPVLVFKHFDPTGKVMSISLDGIWNNQEKHGKRGRLKRVWGNGYYGLKVPIGNPPSYKEATPENPLNVVCFESPIDLMSYYDLKKNTISNAVLLCMNGFKEGVISTYLANELGSYVSEDKKPEVLEKLQKSTMYSEKMKIVLAVDNDEAGNLFVKEFAEGFCPISSEQPPLLQGRNKTDWNDILKNSKKKEKGVKIMAETKLENTHRKEYLKGLEEALTDTFNKMEESEGASKHYLTESQLETILDQHLEKYEQVFNHFKSSFDLLKEPTVDDGNQIKEGLVQSIDITNRSVKTVLSEALQETKQTTVSNIKERIEKLKSLVKDSFTARILAVNNKVGNFVETIDRRFGLQTEEKKSESVIKEMDTNEKNVSEKKEILVDDVKEYISLKEENTVLLEKINNEIEKNPLAEISILQNELKENLEKVKETKDRIEKMTAQSDVQPDRENSSKKVDQLAELVKEKENLKNSQNELVNNPEFLRQEGLLDQFKEIDLKLNINEKKINEIKNGTQQESPQQSADPFIMATKKEENSEKQAIEKSEISSVQETSKTLLSKNDSKINEQFKEQMEQLIDPIKIKEYLESATKFHNYSPKNVQLIKEQNPNATQVANKNKWENLGYELKENAIPIQIYQPKFVPVLDSNGEQILNEVNKPKTRTEFELKPVYDITQTKEGQLKEPITFDFSNEQDFMNVYGSLEKYSKAKIEFRSIGEFNSLLDSNSNTLFVNEGLGKEETIRTILKDVISINESSKSVKNGDIQLFKEEAACFMVANHLGLDTNTFDFSSLSKLKNDGLKVEDFSSSLNGSSKIASDLIETIDSKFSKNKNVTTQQNRFSDRVVMAKETNKQVSEQMKSDNYVVSNTPKMKM